MNHFNITFLSEHQGFPGGSDGEESTGNSGNLESIPGLGRSPGEGNSYSLQYSGLENFHELYSLWGHKESDSTERILTFQSGPLKLSQTVYKE